MIFLSTVKYSLFTYIPLFFLQIAAGSDLSDFGAVVKELGTIGILLGFFYAFFKYHMKIKEKYDKDFKTIFETYTQTVKQAMLDKDKQIDIQEKHIERLEKVIEEYFLQKTK